MKGGSSKLHHGLVIYATRLRAEKQCCLLSSPIAGCELMNSIASGSVEFEYYLLFLQI